MELPIINNLYTIYKEIIQINLFTDKRWRYSLGSKTENIILDCLHFIITAKNAPKQMRAAYLLKADAFLEIFQLHLRLYLELKITNETRVFQIQARANETGRMLGGWLKSLQ